jgi:hypothetical protein
MSPNLYGRLTAALLISALVAGACTSSPQRATGAQSSSPGSLSPPRASASPSSGTAISQARIDPADFVETVDNPYLPFIAGTTFVYEGTRDGKSQRDEVVVTSQKKVILGVTCVVVKDTATHGGALLEQTYDWYAQDREGRVWYFGEDTKEYEKGKVVSTEGSWQAGVDGAQPGILMPAHPEVTDSFRQEYYPGHAEDMFWIVSLGESVTVPYGRFSNVLLTLEWARLEPKVIDKKYYVSGVGLVLEASASGPNERAALVSITKP